MFPTSLLGLLEFEPLRMAMLVATLAHKMSSAMAGFIRLGKQCAQVLVLGQPEQKPQSKLVFQW